MTDMPIQSKHTTFNYYFFDKKINYCLAFLINQILKVDAERNKLARLQNFFLFVSDEEPK